MPGKALDAATAARMREWFPQTALGDVRIVAGGPVSWFVRVVLRKRAMALPPYIVYGGARRPADDTHETALLAHELVHCEQARRMGRPRFFSRYLLDLARARFRYSRNLPLEREAYALQAVVLAALIAGDPPP